MPQQQQMVFYQVSPNGMTMGPPLPNGMTPMGPGNGAPMSPMGPQGPQMMQLQGPPQPANFASPCEPQMPMMALGPQNCGYWGQPGGQVLDPGFYGQNFQPRQMMTIEELPQNYQSIEDKGTKVEAIADAGSEFFPSGNSINSDEVMPTCKNGFIHFKDPETSEDASPTGRPRAASH
jgi:hypothetical protein